jgi:hypothetical protein
MESKQGSNKNGEGDRHSANAWSCAALSTHGMQACCGPDDVLGGPVVLVHDRCLCHMWGCWDRRVSGSPSNEQLLEAGQVGVAQHIYQRHHLHVCMRCLTRVCG